MAHPSPSPVPLTSKIGPNAITRSRYMQESSTVKTFIQHLDHVPTHLRSWVQGIVTSVHTSGEECVLDDGTGELTVNLKIVHSNLPPGSAVAPRVGTYVMAVGVVQSYFLAAHQLIRLDGNDREACWMLEVLEYHQLQSSS